MSQKIIKIGSSLGATLRSDILSSAGLEQGDNILVDYNEKSGTIEIKSARLDDYNKSVAQAIELVNKNQEELAKLDEV